MHEAPGVGYEKGIRELVNAPGNSRETAVDSTFVRYTTVMEDYTRRSLTFDSDVLHAFGGVGRFFAKRQGTEMLVGLAGEVFHAGVAVAS